jgi:signal transduction histidine kinase
MSDEETNTPATDTVKALHLFLLGPEGEGDRSPEKISKELERAGIDVNKMAAKVRKQISQAQNRLRLTEIRAGAEAVAHQLTKPLAAAGSAIADLREAVQQAIDRISDLHPGTAAVFHRKLEESTEDDLASLLADLKDLEAKSGVTDEEER